MEALEAIADLQEPGTVYLSADGTKVIYATTFTLGHKTGEHDVSSIWIADVGEEKSARQLTSGLFNDHDPQWAPDGKSIFFLSDRAEAGKKTALYQLNLSGGEPIPLTDTTYEKGINDYAVSPDGKYLALLAPEEDSPEKKKAKEEKDDAKVYGEHWEFNRLRIMHLATKTIEKISTGECQVIGIVFSPDSKKLAYMTTPTPDVESEQYDGVDLFLVDVATKTPKHISHCQYIPIFGWGNHGLDWAGDRIYATCNSFPGEGANFREGSFVICSVSVSDGTWRKDYGGDSYCINGHTGCGDIVVANVMNGLYDEVHASNEVLFRDLCTVSSVSAVKDPKDSSRLIIAMMKSTVNEPYEVYTFTSSSRTPVQVSNHGLDFSDAAGVAIEVHTRSSDDKVALDGLFVGPKDLFTDNRPNKPLKTVVFPHGGPYDHITSEFMPYFGWQQTLIRSGYAILLPNYRGGASHGSAFASSPYITGELDIGDVETVTQAAVKQGLADPNNLIIGGWSQGGLHAYLAAVRNGQHGYGWRYRGSIAGAGVSHPDTFILTSDIPKGEANYSGGAPWELAGKDMPYKPASALWTFKEAADAGRIPPMLLIHGEADERVPVTQAWGFYRACKSRGIECEMVTYPRAGHMIKERKQLLDMHKRVLKFCDRHFTA